MAKKCVESTLKTPGIHKNIQLNQELECLLG